MSDSQGVTLWAHGMPTPGAGQRWQHTGGKFYIDVTDRYVPCDDAAIERVAVKLYEQDRRTRFAVKFKDAADHIHADYISRARVLLRAAGEQS